MFKINKKDFEHETTLEGTAIGIVSGFGNSLADQFPIMNLSIRNSKKMGTK
jgi:hypothetical protein